MPERRQNERRRSLLGGRIVFNGRRSVIDCLVRNLSPEGACLQVQATAGIPTEFDLEISGEPTRLARQIWQSENRIGIEFARAAQLWPHLVADAPSLAPDGERATDSGRSGDLIRLQLLTLRAALDEIDVGVVLLDTETRAQFINRAFRRMWRLPDAKADAKPPFVALMYHGRDTHAYAVPGEQLDAYVAERVARIRAGDPRPLDLRLANGEIVRLTCTALPAGGRMLCYSYVTDIVRHSDDLKVLRASLGEVDQGVVLLDSMLNIQFINRAAREMWALSEEQAERHASFSEMVSTAVKSAVYKVPREHLNRFLAERMAVVRAGDPMPTDIPLTSGRMVRAQCKKLPGGGRMLMYTDISDLVQRADRFAQLAAIDGLTGLCNRREFDSLAEAEWSRFQRYQRPLSLMFVDIDHFKRINDNYGHDAGDSAIKHVAALCAAEKRGSDVVARFGGDEFAVLMAETDRAQARVLAERLLSRVASTPVKLGNGAAVPLTVSIGIAQATVSMSGMPALCRAADVSLYRAKTGGRNAVDNSEPAGTRLDAAAE
jgi:diguanylate cyclase (GGDEF)-like protein